MPPKPGRVPGLVNVPDMRAETPGFVVVVGSFGAEPDARMPGELPGGLSIVGVPERADARDALCGAASLDSLSAGAIVGTGSLRRRAQLAALRPDLEVRDLRGNVDTRLRRLDAGGSDPAERHPDHRPACR